MLALLEAAMRGIRMRLIVAVTAFSFCLGSTAAFAQRAGTLISAEPVVETPGGSQAWKIAYWTTNADGKRIRVTGMVVAPREAMPSKARDVLAWTHGTLGVAMRCA